MIVINLHYSAGSFALFASNGRVVAASGSSKCPMLLPFCVYHNRRPGNLRVIFYYIFVVVKGRPVINRIRVNLISLSINNHSR